MGSNPSRTASFFRPSLKGVISPPRDPYPVRHAFRRSAFATLLSGVIAFAASAQPVLSPQAPTSPDPAFAIEQEIRANILNQTVGSASVADLGLPDEFVRRFADRVVRSSFEDRYRIVVASAPSTQPDATPSASTPALTNTPSATPPPTTPATTKQTNAKVELFVIMGGAIVVIILAATAVRRAKSKGSSR